MEERLHRAARDDDDRLARAMIERDLGTRGTNQRGTTFGARNLELMLLGHTANGAQSQKGHRVMEHKHWGTAPLGHRVKRGTGQWSTTIGAHYPNI